MVFTWHKTGREHSEHLKNSNAHSREQNNDKQSSAEQSSRPFPVLHRQASEQLVETEEEAVSLRLFMGEPSSTKGRRQRQSDEAGNRNGDRNRDSKLLIEHTGGAAHKGCRNEHTGQDQNRRDNRAGDFRHSQNGCIDRIHGFFGHIAFDVFHHHDGIVHHQTNRQHQTKQRQQVDREPKRQHSHESTSQSDHNGRARNCCGFKALQEDVDHADNKKHCFKQRLNYFIDRNSNKLCRVDSDLVI